jgi:hypothetical protein
MFLDSRQKGSFCLVKQSLNTIDFLRDNSIMRVGQHGFIALAGDTEGNMFGLHSMD